MSKVSICVPTYEFNGRGAFYLQRLLDSLVIQTYKNFEVVISDQSCDNQIFNLLSWNTHDLQIKYFRCDKLPDGNMSHNTNSAIKRATGDIIKPLFQDDLLNSPRVIERLMSEFENPDTNWVGLKSQCMTRVWSLDGKTVKTHFFTQKHCMVTTKCRVHLLSRLETPRTMCLMKMLR